MSEQYPLEGWIAVKAHDHQPDVTRGGCMCGFAVWSGDHVAIMAYREAVDHAAIPDVRASGGQITTEGRP
jgi:hypothetical protein